MKMKHIKTAAKLLVQYGYADYFKTTKTQDGTVVAHWVCWEDRDLDDTCEVMEDLTNIAHLHALEDYLVWNREELWEESFRITARHLEDGQYSMHPRRVDRIKYCVKEITTQED